MIKIRKVKEIGVGTVVSIKEDMLKLRINKKISNRSNLTKYFLIVRKFNDDYFELLQVGDDNTNNHNMVLYYIRTRDNVILNKNILSRSSNLEDILINKIMINPESLQIVLQELELKDIAWEGK